MARRDRPVGEHDDLFDDVHDDHGLFFDDGDHAFGGAGDGQHANGHDTDFRPRPAPTQSTATPTRSRVDKLHRAQARRRRRVLGIIGLVIVLVVGATVVFVGLPIYHYLFPQDYDGNGSGNVVVTVHANDGAQQIGETLQKAGVVGSVRAFTDAAADDSNSQNIQPGSYQLHRHMSAKNALTLLENPASRLASDTVVTEGQTIFTIEAALARPRCGANSTSGSSCGLGVSRADVVKAFQDVSALGLPTDYLTSGKQPASPEGFLFPATYTFDQGTSVPAALQQMIGKFTDEARSLQFSALAKKLKITPYQALIIASIAQSEAKFPEDMPKVARVILNRIAAKRPLQVDATSVYGAKVLGLDPSKINYATLPSAYNSYTHDGLPPTPIGNPGAEAMTGAVHPPAGAWQFYVNGDAAGHLVFLNTEADFIKAATKCYVNKWGCGPPPK